MKITMDSRAFNKAIEESRLDGIAEGKRAARKYRRKTIRALRLRLKQANRGYDQLVDEIGQLSERIAEVEAALVAERRPLAEKLADILATQRARSIP